MDNYGADMDIEMSDEEETENVVQLKADDVVQSMSLCKLDFKISNLDPKNNVAALIEEHNKKIKNPSEWYHKEFSGDDGSETYKQTKLRTKSVFLYHGTTNSEHTLANFITFYYADDGNVYAQTTGSAYHVVAKYGDVEFPHRISGRLLDDAGMKSQTRTPLSGNTVFQQKRCKKPERSYDSAVQNIRIRFTADLRSDASIREPNLNCFVKSDKKIMVKVSAMFVQFDCGIKKDGMMNFINHLNRIYNGQPTKKTDDTWEYDTNAFVEPVRMANDTDAQNLDKALKMRMESYIQQSEDYNTHLSGLDLCQEYVFPFSYGENFKLLMKKNQIQFGEAPTLQMVLDKIRQYTQTSTVYSRNTFNDNNNKVYMTDKIHILYDHDNRRMRKTLFNLIEGTMMYNGQMYHRIKRVWYSMSDDNIRSIHIGFRRFLRDHLIDDQRILKKRWPRNVSEGIYNDLYMNEPDFLVGDGCTYGNIELFDLLRYDPGSQHTYLYHVKRKLDGEIRKLAFQVMAATDILDKCFTPNVNVMLRLEAYYESIVQRYAVKRLPLSKYFNTFEKFRNLLSKKNNLTIICAVFPSPSYDNVMRLEGDATDNFEVDDIFKAYKRLSPQERHAIEIQYRSSHGFRICEFFFRELIDNGYVKPSFGRHNHGYSTSKLLLAHRSQPRDGEERDQLNYFSVCDTYNDDVDGILWKLVRKYSSNFKSTAAKYSLTQMHTSGFDFKICQINGF